jgi:hypothetical protein
VNGQLLKAMLAWAACLPLPGFSPPLDDKSDRPVVALAGAYYQGNGFTHRELIITPEGRFESEESACLGVYDRNSGRAEVIDGRLVLTPDRLNPRRIGLYLHLLGQALFTETRSEYDDPKPRELREIAKDLLKTGNKVLGLAWEFLYHESNQTTYLIPIRWGPMLQLVPSDEGIRFCNLVNLGWAARAPVQCCYVRDDENEEKIEGLPGVPEEWRSMLLKAPLHGRVVTVLPDGRAWIDLGSEHGVWKGMELELEAGQSQVVEVGVHFALIEPIGHPRPTFEEGQGVRSRKRRFE